MRKKIMIILIWMIGFDLVAYFTNPLVAIGVGMMFLSYALLELILK